MNLDNHINCIIKSIKLKHRAWCDYKNFQDPLALDAFKLLRTYIRLMLNIENIVGTLKTMLKSILTTKFWQFIGNKRSSNNLPTAIT